MILETIQDVLEYAEENDVKFVRLAFSDLLGAQKIWRLCRRALKRRSTGG